MIGHLGSKVSALLDGRLPAAEEERAWDHVHGCHFCRDLVEREGWVKTQLASLRSCAVSDGFKSSLLSAAALSPLPSEPGPGFLHRHRAVVVLGSSAVGVAFVGIAALGGVFNGGAVDRRPTMTTIEQPVSSNTPTRVTPSATPVAHTSPSSTPTQALSSAPTGSPATPIAVRSAATSSSRPE